MKRNIFAYLLLLSLCLSGKEVSFPLEWNSSYSTAMPYEVEIDRKRLAEIAGTVEDTGFEGESNGKTGQNVRRSVFDKAVGHGFGGIKYHAEQAGIRFQRS